MILELAGIDTYYGETQALFGMSLAVGAGEIVALLGPNGAGKTTTLRSILAAPSASTAPTSPAGRRTRSLAWAWAGFRTTGASARR
jgi:branched-chain amino acid transport system ATP-binding protein